MVATKTPLPLTIAKRIVANHGEVDPVELAAMKTQTARAVGYWLTSLVGVAYADNFLREWDRVRGER